MGARGKSPRRSRRKSPKRRSRARRTYRATRSAKVQPGGGSPRPEGGTSSARSLLSRVQNLPGGGTPRPGGGTPRARGSRVKVQPSVAQEREVPQPRQRRPSKYQVFTDGKPIDLVPRRDVTPQSKQAQILHVIDKLVEYLEEEKLKRKSGVEESEVPHLQSKDLQRIIEGFNIPGLDIDGAVEQIKTADTSESNTGRGNEQLTTAELVVLREELRNNPEFTLESSRLPAATRLPPPRSFPNPGNTDSADILWQRLKQVLRNMEHDPDDAQRLRRLHDSFETSLSKIERMEPAARKAYIDDVTRLTALMFPPEAARPRTPPT